MWTRKRKPSVEKFLIAVNRKKQEKKLHERTRYRWSNGRNSRESKRNEKGTMLSLRSEGTVYRDIKVTFFNLCINKNIVDSNNETRSLIDENMTSGHVKRVSKRPIRM